MGRYVWLMGFVLMAMLGCRNQLDEGAATPIVVVKGPTATATPTLIATETLAAEEIESVSTPTPIQKAVEITPTEAAVFVTPTIIEATPTSAGSITPTLTPTPTPVPSFLTIREPTFEQLEEYLLSSPVRRYEGDHAYSQFMIERPLGNWFIPAEGTQFYYEDVNHDGEDDLLLLYAHTTLWGPNYLIVMLWTGESYNQPLLLIEGTKLPGSVHYQLADWTGDGMSEIEWDTRTTTSGSSYHHETYTKRLIQCFDECNVVWEEVIFEQATEIGVGNYLAISMFTTEVISSSASAEINITSRALALPYVDQAEIIALKVCPEVSETFIWTGSVFTPTVSYQPYGMLEPGQSVCFQKLVGGGGTRIEFEREVASISNHTAISRGDTATLRHWYIPTQDWIEPDRYDCQISVNEVPLREQFACNPAFTQMWWQDVTGNGTTELIVTTLNEWNVTMFIWQKWDQKFQLVGQIVGRAMNPDLFGVELFNADADIALEVRAADFRRKTNDFCFQNPVGNSLCWWNITVRERVYNWNGWEYKPIVSQ